MASAPTNRLALSSFICGLGGWVLSILLFCFNLTLGSVITAASAGLGLMCLIPLSCISPAMWIAGVVTGHLGLSKIKTTGEGGRGLGIAGLILSYLGLALILCGICALVLAILVGGASILSILSSPSFAIPTPRPFK